MTDALKAMSHYSRQTADNTSTVINIYNRVTNLALHRDFTRKYTDFKISTWKINVSYFNNLL